MSDLSVVSQTLYVPMLGRIHASLYHPEVFFDQKALSISNQLPNSLLDMHGQNEYTLMASAVRSKNADYYVQRFLSKYPDSVIVNVGCGLETTYYRNNNNKSIWFELDLPEVIALRKKYFPENRHDRFLPYSMFDYTWMDFVKQLEKPVMLIATGLFYYFEESKVREFIQNLASVEHAELIFDAVSPPELK